MPDAAPIDPDELAWGHELTEAIRAIEARISAKMATVDASNAGRLLEAERYSANALYALGEAIPAIGTLAQVLAQGGGS